MSDSLVQAIERAILPVLARDGYDVVLTEYVPRAKVLRLYIDREALEASADGSGISLDDCQRVSRIVSDVMDAEGLSDGIDGRFTLEVSSPGLDRPLVKPKDFKRFVGRKVLLTTREMLDGRRKFSGALTSADDSGVHLDVDGSPKDIAYTVIERARLVPEF
jgi:ribosome maturation factor RimP